MTTNFHPIDKELISKLLKNNETLSYSKLNTYFECPFKFLLKHMLKINKPNLDSMSLHIGNFFSRCIKRL